jgi:hypothetical protein
VLKLQRTVLAGLRRDCWAEASRLVILDRSGHFGFSEQTGDTMKAIRELLEVPSPPEG